MSSFTAIFDACVLYPAPLRDFLMQVSNTDLFRARWTETIHEEWIRNVLKNRTDVKPERLARTRQLMNEHVEGCLVTGFEPLIDAIVLPDPDDRHVLAAAIVAGADVIVTFNLSDFPENATRPYNVVAQHPDDFLSHLLDLSPMAVCAAFIRQRESLKNPPRSTLDLLSTLEKQQLPQTVAGLRTFAELL